MNLSDLTSYGAVDALTDDVIEYAYTRLTGLRFHANATHGYRCRKLWAEIRRNRKPRVPLLDYLPAYPKWPIPATDERSRVLMALLRRGASFDSVLDACASVRLGRGEVAVTGFEATRQALDAVRTLRAFYGYGIKTNEDGTIEVYE